MKEDPLSPTPNPVVQELVEGPYPTKEKLLALIAETDAKLAKMQPENKPTWALDARKPEFKSLREVTRARTRTEHRLDKAVRKLRHDFDMNS